MVRSAFEQKARTWREKALNVSRHYGADEEIAQLLGIETTSVSTLLARARRTLFIGNSLAR